MPTHAPNQAPAEPTPTAPTDPVTELRRELRALEQALQAWDLGGIASHETGARLALEQIRHAGLPAGADLRELLELTTRCLRLSDQGSELTGALRRSGTLTYAAPAADTGMRWNAPDANEGEA